MIPNKIHYCWFGGQPFPALIKRCMASWHANLENFEIIEWNESNTPIDEHPYMKLAYEKGKWAFVADYMRMLALYEHGGIYLDTDMEVIRPLSDLLNNKLFMGFETSTQVSAGIIGAVAGDAFFLDCMNAMNQNIAGKKPQFITIPLIMGNILNTSNHSNYIYPKEFFYPYNPYCQESTTSQLMFSDITENTYAIHHWNASWTKPKTYIDYLIHILRYAKKTFPI
ncbi:glycosyltransferase family 32 protein [Pseudomonas sp. BF-R-19]|uniref:glycosyltransferase family 32 protein n=1 Tax=Pseudomonas sp. BF-R-19 TaxID=2832397 RepID=UPI0021DAD35C|nr:glycosyltransferase [Pseudomonas sp. BF-R-19]